MKNQGVNLAALVDRTGGEVESSDFSWEVLIFGAVTSDFSWEVLEFTISTSHFMMCFKHLTRKVLIL